MSCAGKRRSSRLVPWPVKSGHPLLSGRLHYSARSTAICERQIAVAGSPSPSKRMAAKGVRRGKAALSSGCKAHPANSLPPEAIGAVMEVTKWLKPSISVSRIGDSASGQAATRVNAEQASKRTMCRPTRHPYRGRLIRLGRMSEAYSQPLHRGRGGGMFTRKAHATREALWRGQGCPTGRP
jgi:hypothetical protein